MELRYFGDPIFRIQGEPVTEFGPPLKAIAEELLELMYKADGIGLAAHHAGLALQILVLDMRQTDSDLLGPFTLDGKTVPIELLMPLVAVNSKIRVTDDTPLFWEEASVSFPGINGDIERITSLELEFQDTDGAWHTLHCTGRLADCVQHEYDQTQGIPFIDRMIPRHLNANKTKLKQLKRQTLAALKKQA